MKRVLKFLEKRQIPKSRAIFHLVATVVTAGFWLLVAVLIEIYIASSRENKVWEINHQREEKIKSLQNKISEKKEVLINLQSVNEKLQQTLASEFETPFELPVVWLWESREQITAITSGTTLGKTRTGSIGLGWSDGIGWAASQGVTRGTIASQTTEVKSNEFAQLDTGILRIGKDFTAFIGNQFTRTGHYKDILAINTDYDKSIGLAIVNAEKIWLTKFPADFEKEIAYALISAAYSKFVQNSLPNLKPLEELIHSNIEEIEQEIEILEEKLRIESRPSGSNPV
jgi:hypothetical protein